MESSMNDNPLPDQTTPNVGTSPAKPKQRRIMLTLGLIALVVIAIVLVWLIIDRTAHKTAATSPKATISITASGFVPSTVTVAPGTTIVWQNVDRSPHIIASNPYPADSSLPGLHSQTILPGASYSYTPTGSATIHYHDDKMPTANGTITIGK